MKKVKVLHLITELSIGGAQSSLLRLIEHFDNPRFEFSVACFYNADGSVAAQIRKIGVPVFDLGMKNKAQFSALANLYHLLKRERPFILHTWMFHANLPGRLFGRLTQTPVIISSERTMGQEGHFRRRLNRLTVPLTDCVICVSQSVADFASQRIGLPVERLVVIPNGIDPNQFENLPAKEHLRRYFNLPEKAFVIGAIGRPRPVKGYQFLLQALGALAPKFPDVLLLFVGNGPDRERLINQSQRMGLETSAIFWSDSTNIPRLLPSLNILAIPSLYEGMPNVALEAMAAGLPVVATAVGGIPEVVLEGKTGFLVPPRDPEALARAIERIMQNPAQGIRMGQAGRQRVKEQFTIQETVRKVEQLYNTLLSGQRSAP
jgi:glycosyltransferase involved in cell wall biosynthesis